MTTAKIFQHGGSEASRTLDLPIAAQARIPDTALFTNNAREFRRMKGLKVPAVS